jgi:hypothetical protein
MSTRKLILLLSIFIYSLNCFGQTCVHFDISNNYNFKTNIKRYKIADDQDSCIVTITILKKENSTPIQTIKITSDYLFGNTYSDCKAKRSYITLKNAKTVAEDNDFGDIIVADFNFDTLEDIALKNNSGGNGGPMYNFYIQNETGKFVLNKYLSNTMEFFPLFINKKKKTLTTLVHSNAYEQCKSTYAQDTLTNKWKKIGKTFVPYNE